MARLHQFGPANGNPHGQDGTFSNDFHVDIGKNKGKICARINSDKVQNISWTHDLDTRFFFK
jgi:hypothetical protein